MTFSSPGLPPVDQLLRKRHIGNDIVTIIFQEPGALPFTPKNIRSHFQHVFIIVRAHNPCTDNVCYRCAPADRGPPPTHTQKITDASYLCPAAERGEGWSWGPGGRAPAVLVCASVGELCPHVPTPSEGVILHQQGACYPTFDKEGGGMCTYLESCGCK